MFENYLLCSLCEVLLVQKTAGREGGQKCMDCKADAKVKDRGRSRKWSENDHFEGLAVGDNDHSVNREKKKRRNRSAFLN